MSVSGDMFRGALLGTQLIQARQQSQIKEALQNQLNLSIHQQEQTNKIIFGRQFLVSVEEILIHSRKIIDAYPYYAYFNLEGYKRQFIAYGFSMNYFSEIEDIRLASGLLDKLNAELEFFLERFPDAHEIYKKLLRTHEKIHQLANGSHFPNAIRAHQYLEENEDKKGTLDKMKNENKNINKKIDQRKQLLILPFLASIGWTFLFFNEGGWFFTVLLGVTWVWATSGKNLSPSWRDFDREVRIKERVLADAMKKYDVSTPQELIQIPEKLKEYNETYLPTDPMYFCKADIIASQ